MNEEEVEGCLWTRKRKRKITTRFYCWVTRTTGQSKTIERFVARRHGFMGDTELEAARIDMICEHV